MESPLLKRNQQPNPAKNNTKKYLLIAFAIVLFFGVCILLLIRSNETLIGKSAVEKVGELMILPEETPTISTITDIEKLKQDNPEFYKNAVNGDILLLYPEVAIIYREDSNKIVNVAQIEN